MSDFIEGDPFDPETIKQADVNTYEAERQADEHLSAYVRRRKEAYTAVFGGAPSADLRFVMNDLAAFCRAYTSTLHPASRTVQDALEGRREVFYRIKQFVEIPHDDLMKHYLVEKARQEAAALERR